MRRPHAVGRRRRTGPGPRRCPATSTVDAVAVLVGPDDRVALEHLGARLARQVDHAPRRAPSRGDDRGERALTPRHGEPPAHSGRGTDPTVLDLLPRRPSRRARGRGRRAGGARRSLVRPRRSCRGGTSPCRRPGCRRRHGRASWPRRHRRGPLPRRRRRRFSRCAGYGSRSTSRESTQSPRANSSANAGADVLDHELRVGHGRRVDVDARCSGRPVAQQRHVQPRPRRAGRTG